MVLIILLIYLTYNYINKSGKDSNIVEKTESNKLVQKKISRNEETLDKNVISELTYKSLDDNGNVYEINSDSGTIQENDKSTLLLKNVEAKILVYDHGTVYIFSDNALYNKISLDTHFYKNVNLIYKDHNIKSDDLFLKYSDKKVKISNNVYYESENSKLIADEVTMNLLNKVSKIYVTNKKKKVKAIIKN
tara:strand:+ start:219 stop:791 length:573 start_codon:yes stop_codon:yes gene_type:complete